MRRSCAVAADWAVTLVIACCVAGWWRGLWVLITVAVATALPDDQPLARASAPLAVGAVVVAAALSLAHWRAHQTSRAASGSASAPASPGGGTATACAMTSLDGGGGGEEAPRSRSCARKVVDVVRALWLPGILPVAFWLGAWTCMDAVVVRVVVEDDGVDNDVSSWLVVELVCTHVLSVAVLQWTISLRSVLGPPSFVAADADSAPAPHAQSIAPVWGVTSYVQSVHDAVEASREPRAGWRPVLFPSNRSVGDSEAASAGQGDGIQAAVSRYSARQKCSYDILSALGVSFLVVAFWRTVWRLTDEWLLPGWQSIKAAEDAAAYAGALVATASASLAVGGGLFLVCVIDRELSAVYRGSPADRGDDTGTRTSCCAAASNAVAVYVQGIAAVLVWRGAWYTLDALLLGHSGALGLTLSHLAFGALLLSGGTLRAVHAPPLGYLHSRGRPPHRSACGWPTTAVRTAADAWRGARG